LTIQKWSVTILPKVRATDKSSLYSASVPHQNNYLRRNLMGSKLKCVMVVIIVALLLVTALVVSACGTPEFPIGRFVHENHKDWIFQFNEDGTWLYYFEDLTSPEVKGTYSIDGNLYTETSANDPACPFPATYKWTYDGLKLTFNLVGEDKCEGRKSAYDGQTYVKSE
jgi:hypothetical protein